jgi:superfamily II DNA or RNA helicase
MSDIDIIAQAAGNAREKGAKTFYHGSTTPDLATLKATQPNMGSAGVYGADNIDWAALYALAKDRKGMAVIGGANPRLLIHKDNALLPEGNVYEYESDKYSPPPESDPNLGWVVPDDVTPTKTHKVKLTDHMRNIEQFEDTETLRKRFAELTGKAWAKQAAAGSAPDIADKFQPDYTPEQMESLGVYDALYRGQGPRLASLGAWKPEWISEHDPKGWAQWYKRYVSGRRLEDEDQRQIKRWLSFKARHGGPFVKNPTPRRGWALRNWGVDPSKLVAPEQANNVTEMLDEYKTKAMQKYVQDKIAQAQRGVLFPVSDPERDTEAEPGQVSRVASAFSKKADLLPGIQLQPHQQRIADKVTDDENRLLVYHGLGSGKSLSALAAAEAAKRKFGDNYGVVVPAALKGNFDKEIKKFTTSNPEVMSYTALGMGKEFKEQPQTLVMDEAHRLRNPGGAAAHAASRQARSARNLLLLTGSPITNSPTDLANLLSLLHNKQITPEQFEERYIGHKTVSPGILNWFRGIQSGEQPEVQNEGELRALLKGKVDYQPSKNPKGVNVSEETIKVPLSSAQQKIQQAVRTKIPPGFLWKLDQEFPLSRDELAKLNSFMTGLRQVSMSTRPFRADKDPYKAFEQSSKLQTAMKNLQSTLESDPRKKAIIYSNHIDAGLTPYAAALAKNQIPHALFHGSISPTERQKAVQEYNEGKLRALLIGPAGAEGLSTKGTSLIQLLDPHWHESRSQQARGRGLRFDSHEGLPEELKNVAVQRYLSSSEDPSWLGKLMGYKRERTGDEVLERLAREKEMLNDYFRKILQEEGTQKTSAASVALQGVQGWYKTAERFGVVKRVLPYLTGPAAMSAGGGYAGWEANNAFLNEYNPEVTDVGRLRSNLRAATMGAVGGLTARGRVQKPGAMGAWLAGLGLGVRYGITTPANSQANPIALGQYVDPGHAQIPRFLAWHAKPENQQKAREFLADPSKAVLDYGETRTQKELKKQFDKQFVTPEVTTKRDGTQIVKPPPGVAATGKYLKEHTLPSVYASILAGLGSPAKIKDVTDAAGNVSQVPDVRFSDIGTALAPHLAGGAGGAYLGYRTGDTLGNFLFPDNETDEYESRRRQEQRRWWLQFLGGNLGAVGGTAAAIKAMPQIRELMRAKTSADEKQAVGPLSGLTGLSARVLARSLGGTAAQATRATGNFALERAKDLGVGAAITAGQYGLNKAVPGYVPSTSFDDKGNPLDPAADLSFLGGLTAINALASNPFRRALRGRGNAPHWATIWPAGAFLAAGPGVAYPFTHLPALKKTLHVGAGPDGNDKALGPVVLSAASRPEEFTRRLGDDVAARAKNHYANAKNYYDSGEAAGPTLSVLSNVAREAGVPGFGNDDLSKFINSAGLSTLAQGAGIATGGVGGMLAGDWLADKLLTAAERNKLIKKRPGAHRFIRDLASLTGAGLGAYGTLRALDGKLPALLRAAPKPTTAA